MTDQLLFILSIFICGVGLLLFNSAEIFGFYYACKYEEAYEPEPATYLDPQTDLEVTHTPTHKIIVDPDSKEILWFIKYYSEKWFGKKWTKPICGCLICMASYHSALIWIPIYIISYIGSSFSFWLIYVHLIYICCLAGINYIITSIRGLDL